MELGLFIAKYWLEVAFGLVCAAIAWMAKHYMKLIRDDRKRHEDDLINAIHTKMDDQYKKTETNMNEQYTKTQQQMDQCYARLTNKIDSFVKESKEEDQKIYNKIDGLQDGVLQLQGESFKYNCQKMLNQEEPISLLEYEQLMSEHGVYNRLGGNHDGDSLFRLVQIKYENQQTQKKINE